MAPKQDVLVLYGSETGNATALAELLGSRLSRFDQLKPRVLAMNEIGDPSEIALHSLVIFVCSTTGQGELPRNTLNLWKKLLRRRLPTDLLANTNISSFGLGDSSYPRYQWAIRKLHKRLTQLGAKEFAPRGEGDEMSPDGVDAIYENWMNIIVENLVKKYDVGVEIDKSVLLPPHHKLAIDSASSIELPLGKRLFTASCDVRIGKLVQNSRMTAQNHFQDVRKFVIEKTPLDEDFRYDAGDVLALYPQNDSEDVQALIDHQGWTEIADSPCTVSGDEDYVFENGPVEPLTLRTLLTFHLDIMSIPRRTFFSLAWHFSKDHEREQEKLQELSTLEGLQDLYDYANRPRRSIVETITEFDSLKIPVEYLLDLIPALRPRQFSIASEANAPQIQLAIAIVKYKTIIKRIRRGVCSRWIESLSVGDHVPYKIIRNHLMATTSKKIDLYQVPLVMIAPGTGVAPMRSLIRTRINSGPEKSDMVLFFGSRYEKKDYLFGNDWKPLIEDGTLKVFNAFSREGGGYVQTQLANQAKLVNDLIVNKGALIYVCGSSGAMPRQVRLTLIEILDQMHKTWDFKDAENYISSMEKEGRYLQETW